MKQSQQEIKQRYFDKVYENAPIVECNCGCGEMIKNKDRYGRNKKFVNGHNNRKYDDPKQHKREWNKRNSDKRYNYRKKRSHKILSQFIRDFGGKCSNCGLEFDGDCTSIFEFHHLDPSIKEFSINMRTVEKKRNLVEDELKKCILLCANCHRLIHWKSRK